MSIPKLYTNIKELNRTLEDGCKAGLEEIAQGIERNARHVASIGVPSEEISQVAAAFRESIHTGQLPPCEHKNLKAIKSAGIAGIPTRMLSDEKTTDILRNWCAEKYPVNVQGQSVGEVLKAVTFDEAKKRFLVEINPKYGHHASEVRETLKQLFQPRKGLLPLAAMVAGSWF